MLQGAKPAFVVPGPNEQLELLGSKSPPALLYASKGPKEVSGNVVPRTLEVLMLLPLPPKPL